ncbi:MAG TPA: hypothetical protein VFK02_22360 [Kofleriaceae bacterium]|nr:hypothetical protein [Kofleriaceae bacterium]
MSRPLALLLHSGGLTSRQWRKLVQRLEATHDVLAPDLLGYGSEPWPPGEPFEVRRDVERGAEGYAQITAPTLLLGGARTPMTEQRTLERLARAMPHARLERLPDMGHMGPITHAEVVNAAIAAHLTSP